MKVLDVAGPSTSFRIPSGKAVFCCRVEPFAVAEEFARGSWERYDFSSPQQAGAPTRACAGGGGDVENPSAVDHLNVTVSDPTNGHCLFVQPSNAVIPIMVSSAYFLFGCTVFRFPSVLRYPLMETPDEWYSNWMPHPAIIQNVGSSLAEIQGSMEVIKVVLRPFLPISVTCRTTLAK